MVEVWPPMIGGVVWLVELLIEGSALSGVFELESLS